MSIQTFQKKTYPIIVKLLVKGDEVNSAIKILSQAKELGDELKVQIDSYTPRYGASHKTLYVSNIPQYVEEYQLIDLFSSQVEVLNCRIQKRDGSPNCVAFIDVPEDQMSKALFKFNLYPLNGREISVTPTKSSLSNDRTVTLYLTNIPIEMSLDRLFDTINPKVPLITLRFPKKRDTSIKTYVNAFCEIYQKDVDDALEILNRLDCDGLTLRASVASSQTKDKLLKR